MYPTHLRYTKEHEWIDPTNPARARIGITDHAQSELGDIVGFELPEVDARFEQNATFGVVESVKAVSDLFMPVAGRVVSVNAALEEKPELVNESPHEHGWMMEVEVDDPKSLEALMDAGSYESQL